MAAHIRQRIRVATASLLANLSTTGSRVYRDQFYALSPDSELPCLVISTPEEDTSASLRCHPGEMTRKLSLVVEGIATASSNLTDVLDQIAKEVETKMATSFTLSGLVKDMQLVSTALQGRGGDSPQPVGSVRMTWAIRTSTLEGVPDVVT